MKEKTARVVYLFSVGEYSDYSVVSVHATRAGAEAAHEAWLEKKAWRRNEPWRIEERTLKP